MRENSPKKSSLKYELLLIAMSVIWGSTFVAQQLGMERGLGPMTFTGLRFAFGALSLIPLVLWRKKHLPPPPDSNRFPLAGSLTAGFFLFAAASFQQIGLQYTTSANAGFITGFYIVFVALIGMLLRHKAGKGLWLGIVICMVGFYFLSVTKDFTVRKGDLLVLICALLWAGQILVIDHVANKGDTILIALLQFVVCAVLSGLSALLFEQCSLAHVKAAAGPLAYAGFISVGVAFTLQVVCQKRCPAGPAAVIMSMEAVFAALAGYVILDQTLSGRASFGCALILCGMLVVQLAPLIARKRFAVPGTDETDARNPDGPF